MSFVPSAQQLSLPVTSKPRIHTGVSQQARVAAAADNATNTSSTTTPSQPRNPYVTTPQQISEERGDASCYAFWQCGRDCIFDVRITDTEAHSHRNKEPAKVPELQEKEKKGKYLQTCHELRKDFTPLVCSVDGMTGKEARYAESRLAYHFASKYICPKSQLTGFVRARLALAIARASSLLIQGSRNQGGSVRANIANGSALQHAWQCWQER